MVQKHAGFTSICLAVARSRQGTRDHHAPCTAGPTLQFYCPAIVAVCGAEVQVAVDGEAASTWTVIHVPRGGTLAVGGVQGTTGVGGGHGGGTDARCCATLLTGFMGSSFPGFEFVAVA